MKKICVILASRKGRNSNTAKVIRDMIQSAEETASDLEVLYLYLEEYNIVPCKECENCFKTGICMLDKQDSMEELKAVLLNSDYMIWGTGVFLHNINSQMSTFLERLAVWTHVFRLAGKGSTVVITAESNGFLGVANYMTKILSYLGTCVAEVVVISRNERKEPEVYRKLVKEAGNKISDTLGGSRPLKANQMQEAVYHMMKQIVSAGGLSEYEEGFWVKERMAEYSSYQSFIQSKIITQ